MQNALCHYRKPTRGNIELCEYHDCSVITSFRSPDPICLSK